MIGSDAASWADTSVAARSGCSVSTQIVYRLLAGTVYTFTIGASGVGRK